MISEIIENVEPSRWLYRIISKSNQRVSSNSYLILSQAFRVLSAQENCDYSKCCSSHTEQDSEKVI